MPPILDSETPTDTGAPLPTVEPPAVRVPTGGGGGMVTFALQVIGRAMAASPRLTSLLMVIAVSVTAGPWGVDIFLGDYLNRYLDLRERQIVSGEQLVEHEANGGHIGVTARVELLEARVDELEGEVAAAAVKIDSTREIVGGVETITVALCVGLKARLDLGVDCFTRRP